MLLFSRWVWSYKQEREDENFTLVWMRPSNHPWATEGSDGEGSACVSMQVLSISQELWVKFLRKITLHKAKKPLCS